MNKKSINLIIATVLTCTTLLYGCSSKSKTESNSDTKGSAASQVKASIIGNKTVKSVISGLITYDKEDTYVEWKNKNPNYIELNGSTADLKGSGAEINKGKVTINKAGIYVISGKLDNGQIIVDVQDKGTVRLVLNGVEINSPDNAAIYIKNSEKTVISLEEGTTNSIYDGTKYVLEDSSTDEPSAAIFSKDNLVINGTGKLIVKGNYKDGITSKDDLKITGGNIQITSVDDGLVGRDIIGVKEGNITIEAGGDAVKSNNDTENTKGIVAIENGTFNLKAKNDGIQAETAVLISDGNFSITSGGGSVNGTKKAEDSMDGPGGKDNKNFNTTTEAELETESAKAIKAVADIGISGGTFNIDSSDDALHSNNNAIIEGGNFTITSGDDGLHADTILGIKGGKINIKKSYEGIESSLITISDGEIHVTSDDDGINVAGGVDGSSTIGNSAPNNLESSGNNMLNINGGYVVVNAVGDGLDSNGSIKITKGTVVVYGPTANMNGALDYNGTFEMTGGFLIAAGSLGMMQAPSDTSTQYSIAMTYPQTQKAGTIVNLQDSKGNSIATFAPLKEYQSVLISSPELKKGESYTLYSGGSSTGTLTDGFYKDGKYENGTKIVSFTISDSVTWLNESGITTPRSSMPGGGHGGEKGQRPPRTQDQNLPETENQSTSGDINNK
jgi:hypothetical protein